MKRILPFLLLLLASTVKAQPNRYKEAIFQNLNRQNGVQYAEADRYDLLGSNNPEPLYFDFFEPAGDTATLRPLVLTFFGGFFLAGNRNWADMEAWCDSLASYGYAAATVQYRLGYDPTRRSVVRAGYRAVQDARAAIRYFKANHALYRIDTTQILLVGNSAGAITALQAPAATDADRPAETFAGSPFDLPNASDLGCMDCIGDHQNHSANNVRAVISLWGGTPYPSGLDSSDQTNLLLIHGEQDNSVPIDSGATLGNPLFPIIYGSRTIHSIMTALGKDSRLIVYPNEGHNFYVDGALSDQLNTHWDTIWAISHRYLCEFNPYCDQTSPLPAHDMTSIDLSIFPNPAEDHIYLSLHEAGHYKVELYNLLGEQLFTQKIGRGTTTLQTEGIPSGIYLCKVAGEGRERVQKVVVR